jgi:excisionase family DNA binding protein
MMNNMTRQPAPTATIHAGSRQPARHPGNREAVMEYWRVERVANYLDVSKKRVYQLVQEKRLQAIRLGPRQMRILRGSIENYVSELLAADEEEGE